MARFNTLLTFFMITMSLTAWSQETAAQAPAAKGPSAGQVLSSHYARTYQMAMRYNDFEMAKHALYNIYVENPQNDSILFSLSALYMQSGQHASAVLSAQDVLQMRPQHTGAMEIAAVSFENLGLKDKALTHYESLYLQTDDFQTLYKIAFLQYELDRLNESKTNVEILLTEEPKEKLTAIFETANKEQKEYPINVALLNLKGMIEQKRGEKAAAKKSFEDALKIAPDFLLAKQNLQELK